MRFSPILAVLFAACTTDPGAPNSNSWESVDDVNEQTNNTVDADGIGLEASPARVSFEASCIHAVAIAKDGLHGAAAFDALLTRVEADGGDGSALRALKAARQQAIGDRYPQLQNAASLGDLPGFSCPDLQMVLEERL